MTVAHESREQIRRFQHYVGFLQLRYSHDTKIDIVAESTLNTAFLALFHCFFFVYCTPIIKDN